MATKDNTKENIKDKPFKSNRKASRKKRGRNKCNADTLAIQDRLLGEGHISVAEMAMLMASDAFEDLANIEKKFGVLSDEYKDARAAANACIKTALPYYAKPATSVEVVVKEEVDEDDVKASIQKMLKANPLSLDIE